MPSGCGAGIAAGIPFVEVFVVSLFSDLWAANVAPAFAACTSTNLPVTYTPKGGTARALTVDVHDWGKKIDDDNHHLTEYDWIKVIVDNDDVTGMTDPGLGDALIVPSISLTDEWDFFAVVHRGEAEMQVEFRRTKIYRAGQATPADL